MPRRPGGVRKCWGDDARDFEGFSEPRKPSEVSNPCSRVPGGSLLACRGGNPWIAQESVIHSLNEVQPRSGLRDVLQVTLTGVEAGVEVALLACVHHLALR